MKDNLAYKINQFEKPTDHLENIKKCIKAHVADIKPAWYGNKNFVKSLSGGMLGAAETIINRCEPPLEISRLSLCGGKSIAIIGQNGSGKSTLFDALMNRNNSDFVGGAFGYNHGIHSEKSLRIARLDQEEILRGLEEEKVADVLESLIEYSQKEFFVNWEDPELYDENLTNQDAQQRINELVSQVQNLFEINIFLERKVSELSGGEKTKLSLTMILASEPDVLLLDEPTNHLDLESIAKLMGLFDTYKKAGVSIASVSHVDWFLKMVGQDGTIELQADAKKRKAICSSSPYNKFTKNKPDKNIIAGEIEWNNEYLREQSTSVFLNPDEFSIPESPLIKANLPTIQSGDIVIFSGKNGTGKTKLMEEMADRHSKIMPKEKGIQTAYMPQFWPEEIANGTVENFFNWVKENINPHSNKLSSRFTKEINRLNFGHGEKNVLQRKLSSFSGGEQRILWFIAASIIEGTDVLILDEPSNHMDNETMNKLLTALRAFDGAAILSTHDLRLMEELEKNAGKARENKGIRNFIFDRDQNGHTKINENKISPAAYAKETINKARKTAKRVKTI